MLRIVPWVLMAATAVGCAAATPASLTMEAEAPAYTVAASHVIPHVLDTSGSLNSRQLKKGDYAYKAKIVFDRDTGRSKIVTDRDTGRSISLEAFALNTHAEAGAEASDTDLQPVRLTVELPPDDMLALKKEVGGVDDDCDGLAAAEDLTDRPHLLITISREDADRSDEPPTTLRFYGLCPSSGDVRNGQAGTVVEVLTFAGMAINEQGLPAKKAKKAAKKAAR